jgi:hypothetical protein
MRNDVPNRIAKKGTDGFMFVMTSVKDGRPTKATTFLIVNEDYTALRPYALGSLIRRFIDTIK